MPGRIEIRTRYPVADISDDLKKCCDLVFGPGTVLATTADDRTAFEFQSVPQAQAFRRLFVGCSIEQILDAIDDILDRD